MQQTDVTIGIAHLSDCAPIVAAKERGTFAELGLNAELRRFSSWAAMRDALGTGAIDAAHMLSPMVIASAAGLGPFPRQFTSAFSLNLNGNAITVSLALFDEIERSSPRVTHSLPFSASALKPIIARRHQSGEPLLTFAHVYPHSMHAYELRYWLAAGGVNPDTDVQLVVIPPEQMVDALAAGQVDGFCVGEPWNAVAVSMGLGCTLITSGEIWSNSPEKVLAVRRSWADDNPESHDRTLRALLRSTAWVDAPSNRVTAALMITEQNYVDASFEQVVSSLTGDARQTAGKTEMDLPDFNIFHRYAANFPWLSHAKWILSQMIRWGEVPKHVDIDSIAREAFQPGEYRRIAAMEGIPCPTIDEKIEGSHAHAWILNEATHPIAFSSDMFIDKRVFDPNCVAEFLSGFEIQFSGSRLGPSDQEQTSSSFAAKLGAA